jgi:glutamate dehydrogenase/leucine dehydrogenase
VIAGAANNQLGCGQVGANSAAHNFLYATAYIINAGGIIDLPYEWKSGYEHDKEMAHTVRI